MKEQLETLKKWVQTGQVKTARGRSEDDLLTLIGQMEVALRQPPVSGQSEQLACIHNLERLRLIGGNITCLDCQSTWVRQANCH